MAWRPPAPTSRVWKPRPDELSQAVPIVEARNLSYAVNGRSIFRGLDLDILPGRVTAVMGPSGTGKTTLLRLITGQLRPLGGSLIVAGQDMRSVRRDALYALRKRMGMLFQNGALLTDLSVFENVAFRCASTRTCRNG